METTIALCWYALGLANMGIVYKKFRLDWVGIKFLDWVCCFAFSPITFILVQFY